MTHIKRALAVVGMTVAIAGGISAAPAAAHTPPTCGGIGLPTLQAMDTLNIRSTPWGTIVGSFPKNAITLSPTCATSKAGYTACGHTSYVWRKVSYRGVTGYIVNACLKDI